jgi:hypothetical protein
VQEANVACKGAYSPFRRVIGAFCVTGRGRFSTSASKAKEREEERDCDGKNKETALLLAVTSNTQTPYQTEINDLKIRQTPLPSRGRTMSNHVKLAQSRCNHFGCLHRFFQHGLCRRVPHRWKPGLARHTQCMWRRSAFRTRHLVVWAATSVIARTRSRRVLQGK